MKKTERKILNEAASLIKSLLTGNPRKDRHILKQIVNTEEYTAASQLKSCRSVEETIYQIVNDIEKTPRCSECDRPAVFKNWTGYGRFCSNVCKNNFNKRSIKEKFDSAMLEKHGVVNPSLLKESVIKRRQTTKQRFGVECVLSVKEKKESGMLARYGVTHPSQSATLQNKKKDTCLNKYGVKNNLLIPHVAKKAKEGSIKSRYKARRTTLEKSYDLMMTSKYYTPLFSKDEYCKYEEKYLFKCAKCNMAFEHTMYNGFSSVRCAHCYPKSRSQYEVEICDYIKELGFETEQNLRSVISPYEIDIYIKNQDLAIEFNGLYWHSSQDKLEDGSIKNLHINKTNMCRGKSIKLLHIFENEWINPVKKNIWKSIISNALSKSSERIYARKCNVVKLEDSEIEKFFFEKNHLQGYRPSKYCFALVYNNEIVSMMSVGYSRFNKNYKYEIMRFAGKTFTNVIGGFTRLYSAFIKSIDPESVITYADLRYGEGGVYNEAGFSFAGGSKPNYYYIDISGRVYSRMVFQKHKLKKFLNNYDDSKSESENMYANKYRRIWDCGNNIYVWKKERAHTEP